MLRWDFYKGKWTFEEGPVVMLHGFAPINTKSINEISNLPNGALPGDWVIVAPTKEELKDALKVLCEDGAEWNVSTSGARTLAPDWLIPEAKFWVHWVKNRFSLTTHDNSISWERIRIIYYLHKAIKFNFRKLLHRNLNAIHNKPKEPLLFPWLVEKLCSLGEVFPEEGDVEESKCYYHLHSTWRMLMGSVDCPKTKREREENERRVRVRQEIRKGNKSVVALPKNKKKKATARDLRKVIF